MTRPEARPRLTGETLYTADLDRPELLHGALVRSRVPAGTILEVDTSAALAVSGVSVILTGADVPDVPMGLFRPDEPLLATSAVRYVGEPVALVAADTPEAARAAADLVKVRTQPLPAAVHLADAVVDNSPRVQVGSANVTEESRIRRGDVEAAFAGAYRVVVTTVTSHRVHQAYLEPRASLAETIGDTLVVHTSSQAPFEVQQGLAGLFGLPLSRVVVRVPAIGGGFGGKLHMGLAGHAAVLARATGRPVLLTCSREEEFQSPAPRESSLVHLESAVAEDGRILARRARIHLDSGAYAYDTPPIAAVAAMLACGPYEVDAVDIAGFCVLTNSVPTGSFRGPSGPQMSYAVETHMNEIADALGLDPVNYRRRLGLRTGSLGPGGQVIETDAFLAVLEEGANTVERWRSEPVELLPHERRGVGLGCAWWTVSPVGGAVTLSVAADGSVVVQTGATEIGTGAVSTGLRRIVADDLGIDADLVQVVSGGTDTGPYDHGSQGSRTLYGVGTATARAVTLAKNLIAEEFARQHEAAASDVVFADGQVAVEGIPTTATSFAEVAAAVTAAGGPLAVAGRFQPVGPAFDAGCVSGWVGALNEPTFHCQVADVVVDTETGGITVRRVRAVHDVGAVVNEPGAVTQVEGGVLQGVGYALSEEILTDDSGRTRNDNLHDYGVPTLADIPDAVEVCLVTGFTTGQGHEGLKGIGEAPVIPTAAAIGSAVREALGAQPHDLPLHRERIARMCDSQAPLVGEGADR